MNTKKLFFGLMAIAFLALAAVSTDVITKDVMDQEVSIDRKKFRPC